MRSLRDDLTGLLTGGNRVKDQRVDDGVGADSQMSGVRLTLEVSDGEHIPLDAASALTQGEYQDDGEQPVHSHAQCRCAGYDPLQIISISQSLCK